MPPANDFLGVRNRPRTPVLHPEPAAIILNSTFPVIDLDQARSWSRSRRWEPGSGGRKAEGRKKRSAYCRSFTAGTV